jgi:predicted TIM-barrel fold metal-dependent hydrolase
MIVDVHAHIFPFLGGASGFDSVSTHMRYWQKVTADAPAQAARRATDNSPVQGQTLWDPSDSGPGGALDACFRIGSYGALEWTKDGVEYRLQQYAPSLQEMTASPEYMLVEMDYADVDVAVLQNMFLYGQLNEYFAAAVQKFPRRFVGQVQIMETQGFKESQIIELRKGVRDLGLTGGLYFSDRRFWENDYQDHIDDAKYFPLWEEVRSLGIPVFWCLSAIKDPANPRGSTLERYMDQLRRLGKWATAFPDIACVLVHGLQLPAFTGEDGKVRIPEEVWGLLKKPNIYVEILFPIQASWPRPGNRIMDYPYSETWPIIRELYSNLGAERLLWGSDMPNVSRNCTYRQSFDYLVRYCEFITPSHMDMIVGGNAVHLLGIRK